MYSLIIWNKMSKVGGVVKSLYFYYLLCWMLIEMWMHNDSSGNSSKHLAAFSKN